MDYQYGGGGRGGRGRRGGGRGGQGSWHGDTDNYQGGHKRRGRGRGHYGHRGRGRGGGAEDDTQDGEGGWPEHRHKNPRDRSQENRERPPPGLKGRDIGMWYAARSKKKTKEQELQSRPYIKMDKTKEQNITRLLSTIRAGDSVLPQPSQSYQDPSRPDAMDSDDEEYIHSDKQQDVRSKHPGTLSKCASGNNFSHNYFEQGCSNSTGSSTTVKQEPAAVGYDPFDDGATYVPLSSSLSDMDVADSWEDHDVQGPGFGISEDKFRPEVRDRRVNHGSRDQRDPAWSHDTNEMAGLNAESASDSDDEDEMSDEELLRLTCEAERGQEPEDDSPDVIDLTTELYKPEDLETESEFLTEFYENKQANRHSSSRLNELVDARETLTRKPALDQKLIDELQDKERNSSKFRQMMEFRKKLPSYKQRQEVIRVINSNQVTVISGETGCGKTTQVSQFILDDCIRRGNGSLCRIVCTQPRRISAISVAERVAEERDEGCGTASVGYQIRLEARLPRDQGSILYCTTGIMLKWLVSDPWLSKTSHVILDEIHERDLQSDFLMIVLKALIQRRSDLKLILMSATLNAEMFSQYFGKCPMLNIPGFTYPVKEYVLEEIIEMTRYRHNDPPIAKRSRGPFRNKKKQQLTNEQTRAFLDKVNRKYSRNTAKVLEGMDPEMIDIDLAAHIVDFIVRTKEDGAILVFMPGWEQIKKLNDILSHNPMYSTGRFRIIPLHSLMPTVNQREVFKRPPPGVRKIIIATNIAETSITIDDVVYVIDCGKIKMKNYDPENNITTLEPEWVSHANAKQRRGRAGRVQPGECFHMYTSQQGELFEDYQLPEILRTQLEELCLQIKLLRLGNIEPFVQKAMQPPSMESLHTAIKNLQNINALDAKQELTPLGYHLAKMPVDPHTGKMLLFAAMFCCLDPILTIASSLSFKDAFYIPLGKEQIADERRLELSAGSKSDHIMLANAYSGWERACSHNNSSQYCYRNFLSFNTLKMLKNMRQQFAQLLCDMKFLESSDPKDYRANTNSKNEKLVKAIICAGLYPNVARISKSLDRINIHSKRPIALQTVTDRRVLIHPKSVNCKQRDFESMWFIYHLKMKTTNIFLYDCSMVSPYPLLFFGGAVDVRKDHGQECIIVDDWIIFRSSRKVAHLVQELRQELDKLLEHKIQHPGVTSWNSRQKEGALMRAILDLITTEEPAHKPKH